MNYPSHCGIDRKYMVHLSGPCCVTSWTQTVGEMSKAGHNAKNKSGKAPGFYRRYIRAEEVQGVSDVLITLCSVCL